MEDDSVVKPEGVRKDTPDVFFDKWTRDIDSMPQLATAWEIAHDERNRLVAEQEQAEYKARLNKYSRPSNWAGRLFGRFLGDLPKNAQIIHPTAENLSRVGKYWLPAVLTMAGAIGLLVFLSANVPILRSSPNQLVSSYLISLTGDVMGNILSIVVMFGMLVLLAPNMKLDRSARFWDAAAMAEEQWFRMGAESWSAKQRASSCISFGFMHIVNWIYPLSSLIVLMMVGGVFMLVYLREYKRSNDTVLATLASTKMHASYNRLVVVYFLVAIAISISAISFD